MNIKVNQYFLVLSVFSIILIVLNFLNFDKRNVNNVYINNVEEIFDNLEYFEKVFNDGASIYFETNTISKYYIKEIRDGYTDIKHYVKDVIEDINKNKLYYEVDKRYIVNLLNDLLGIIDNNFIENDIFNVENDIFIKNIQRIIDECKIISNKYNLLKFNFGLVNI